MNYDSSFSLVLCEQAPQFSKFSWVLTDRQVVLKVLLVSNTVDDIKKGSKSHVKIEASSPTVKGNRRLLVNNLLHELAVLK